AATVEVAAERVEAVEQVAAVLELRDRDPVGQAQVLHREVRVVGVAARLERVVAVAEVGGAVVAGDQADTGRVGDGHVGGQAGPAWRPAPRRGRAGRGR